MSGHTPGPWSPCQHWRHPDCPCGEHPGYIWDSTGNIVIAQMGCQPDEGGMAYPQPAKPEARANAHLMAASPELKKALNNLAAFVRIIRGNIDPIANELLAASAAALLKAGGK